MSDAWSVYDDAVRNVAENKHEIVYRFQFKKLENKDDIQWWTKRDLVTGEDSKKFGYKADASKNPYIQFRPSNKLIWADTKQFLTPDEVPSNYDLNLKLVADKKHELVRRYQFVKFKMLEREDDVQWWNKRDLMTKKDSRIAEKDPIKAFWAINHLIWADTLTRPTQAELEGYDDNDAVGYAPDASRGAAAGVGSKRQINRDYSLQQRHAILNEVVFGNHNNSKGTKISPFRRDEHGNNGRFFKSVVTNLNSQANGPFSKARAVVDTVKTYVETAVEGRKKKLETDHGAEYMKRADWDMYDHSDTEFNEDGSVNKSARKTESNMRYGIEEMLDALVYNAFSAEEAQAEQGKTNAPVYTDADDQGQAATANGTNAKKQKREHQVEKVRAAPQSAVAQIEMKQNSMSKMIESITSLISAPVMPALPFQSPATPAIPLFDDELLPLLNSLKTLPEAPGTTAVCKTLASSLGNYGIISLQELRDMSDAEEILKGLQWTPLQIQKVLHPKR